MIKVKYDQSKKAKEQFYSVLIPELKKGTIDKEDVMIILGTNNRSARQEICEISMHYPVIAYGSKRGYRICDVENVKVENFDYELKEIQKTLNDLYKKSNTLKKKMKPLIAAQKVLEKRKAKT